MSRFARDRKKQWRVLFRVAKEQGIELEIPNNPKFEYRTINDLFESLFNSSYRAKMVHGIFAPNPLLAALQGRGFNTIITAKPPIARFDLDEFDFFPGGKDAEDKPDE